LIENDQADQAIPTGDGAIRELNRLAATRSGAVPKQMRTWPRDAKAGSVDHGGQPTRAISSRDRAEARATRTNPRHRGGSAILIDSAAVPGTKRKRQIRVHTGRRAIPMTGSDELEIALLAASKAK
jgi:hypothetical protein